MSSGGDGLRQALAAVLAIALLSLTVRAQTAGQTAAGRTVPAAPGAAIDVLPVHGQVHLLASTGGNAAVHVGPQGVLVVQDRKDMYFNGEAVGLIHVPGAHTDGDSLVFFRSSDVICAGDVYVTTSYPRIDLSRGGHVNGIIEALNQLVDLVVSEQFTEGGTQVIPGHGRISDELDVVEYRDMMTIVRDRVQDMITRGLFLDQVRAARPTLDWDTRYGSERGPWMTAMFVEAVFRTVTATATASH